MGIPCRHIRPANAGRTTSRTMILSPFSGWTPSKPPLTSLSVFTFAPPVFLPPPPPQPPGGERYKHMRRQANAGNTPPKSEWRPLVDEMMNLIPDLGEHGLDEELAEALTAGFDAFRECTRLFASVPFLFEDAATYRELVRGVHAAVERAQAAHLRVDVRLRRGGATGALLALVNDVLTVKVNTPLDPPNTPAEYSALLQKLDALSQKGASRGPLFQPHGGREIPEAVVHELALIPARPSADGPPVVTLPPEQIDAIAAAVRRSVSESQPKGKAASGKKPGNRTLEERGEMKKLNVYRRIHALYDRREGPQVGRRERFLMHLKTAEEHLDLRHQITDAGLTLDLKLIKNALACIEGQKKATEVAKAD